MCNNCEESYHFYCINSSPPPSLLLFRRQSRKYAERELSNFFHCFSRLTPQSLRPSPAFVVCGSQQTKIPTAAEIFTVTGSLDSYAVGPAKFSKLWSYRKRFDGVRTLEFSTMEACQAITWKFKGTWWKYLLICIRSVSSWAKCAYFVRNWQSKFINLKMNSTVFKNKFQTTTDTSIEVLPSLKI